MENIENKEKKYWGQKFYGSILNTALLFVLIILMIVAIKIMLHNESLYFPYLQNGVQTEKEFTKSNTSIDYLGNKIPLYPGVSWGKQIPDDFYLSSWSLKGESVASVAYVLDSTSLSTKNEFRNFYTEEMAKIGYHEALEIIADGPGASLWGYTNGEKYLILSYEDEQIKPNKSEIFDCPCNEQLKVFLGQKISD